MCVSVCMCVCVCVCVCVKLLRVYEGPEEITGNHKFREYLARD